jgi:hypothetical protein
MSCKHEHKEPKQLPYGATRGRYWCHGCDCYLVPEWLGPTPKNIKAKARQQAKKDLKKELDAGFV